MAIEVKVPKISEGVESAEVVEILVSEGDTIEEEQSIIAVETDKASVEVPSSDAGKVKEIKVKEGDEIKVGDVILVLEESGDAEKKEAEDKEEKQDTKEPGAEAKEAEQAKEKPDQKEDKEDKEQKAESEEKGEADAEAQKDEIAAKKETKEDQEAEKKEQETKEKEEDQEKAKETDQEVPASPAVRRLARELGVEIRAVEGSGPGGRITEEDVKSKTRKDKDSGKAASPQPDLPDFSQWGTVEREPLSNIRLSIARNLSASWQAIPHVTQFDQADISNIEEYRQKNSGKAEKAGGKLTITAIMVKIVANALQQFPKFNASLDLDKEEVILKKYFHIGIAVDTEKGLLVPVVRDVDKKTIMELAVEINELAEKARSGKLSPEDMQGGNIAISNLGGIGGTNFTPLVYHPQVAILGLSRASTQPVFMDGKFEPRQVLPLSLSYDHRLIDGAEGTRFLHWIKQALEDPYKALLGA